MLYFNSGLTCDFIAFACIVFHGRSCSHVSNCAEHPSCVYIFLLCPLQKQVCLYHPPYGGLLLVFSCPGAREVHLTLESSVCIAQFLLHCDISLSGQSNKSHMT